MAQPRRTAHDPAARSRAWFARIVVWTAFVVVAWQWGPRAVAVLASRAAPPATAGPEVDLDLVRFVERPQWLDERLLLAISRDLQPWLAGGLQFDDEAAARALLDGLCGVAWVVDARLERVYPHRFRVRFGLRRPVLAVRDELGRPLCLCDQHGVLLPWVDRAGLPTLLLRSVAGDPGTLAGELGELAPDDRVVAAAAIAVEWRDEVAPRVPGCPPLVEIDTTNLGERWVSHPNYPEVRVLLARQDGGRVVFGYGRPCHATRPRVPIETKVAVLRAVLEHRPGLEGLVAGDLRFEVRWRTWLQPSQGQ